jgi:hypothetical protein
MDARETICVEVDVDPDGILQWLHALSVPLVEQDGAVHWVIGPRTETDALVALQLYTTVALYAVPPGLPYTAGDVALSVTLLPPHRRRLGLEVRRWSPFPAALGTVLHLLTAQAQEELEVPRAAASHPALGGRPWAGAPPLVCNLWLEARLANLPPRTNANRLYRAWLEQYRALRGYYPADPRRSYRAAVAGCRRRQCPSRPKR